jgi:hypothetical protein
VGDSSWARAIEKAASEEVNAFHDPKLLQAGVTNPPCAFLDVTLGAAR